MKNGFMTMCMVISLLGVFQASPCFSLNCDLSAEQLGELSSRAPDQETGGTLTRATIDQFIAGAHSLKARINSPDYSIKSYNYDIQNGDNLMDPSIGIIDLTIVSKYLSQDVVFQFYYTYRGEKWIVMKFSAVVDNTRANQFEPSLKPGRGISPWIELPQYEQINERIQLPNNVYNKLFLLMCEPF